MTWTPVPKPTESSALSMNGDAQAIGMLMAITSITGAVVASVTTGWGSVPKPMVSTWNAVPKPQSSVWTFVAKPN